MRIPSRVRVSPSAALSAALSAAALSVAAFNPVVSAQEHTYGIGTPATATEIREAGLSIGPDGRGLPPGRGTAQQGALVFSRRRCPTCHGPNGREGPGPVLIYEGGRKALRSTYDPPVLWPFAPTIWDFINRAMPFDQPGWLTPDEVYSLTAFLLYRNGVIKETDVMDATTLPQVQMPNRSAYDPALADWKPGTPRGFVLK